MDIQSVWVLILAVSVPIGGVIGFFLQLRQMNNERQKNELLALEIRELKTRIKDAEQVIVRATPAEISAYGNKMAERDLKRCEIGFSLARGEAPKYQPSVFSKLRKSLRSAFWASLAFSFFAYLLYDLFRVGQWLVALIA